MALSHPPPHYFRGGVRGKLHCPRPMPGDINILLTSPRAGAPPNAVLRPMPPMPSVEGWSSRRGRGPGQTRLRTLPHHRAYCRFSDHALHLPSKEVERSPKPTPIRHVRTHHSRSITTGPGPAPQRVCLRQNSRHIEPAPARCCSLGPRSMSPV